MKVSELIAELQKMPGNLDVIMLDDDGAGSDSCWPRHGIGSVETDTYFTTNSGAYVHNGFLSDIKPENKVQVVVLLAIEETPHKTI